MPREGDLCNCGDCQADPDLACSYTGDDVSVLSNYVANAYKGNLLLCPGGDNGEIGGLLHQLNPPQHYSHMGIFVANHDLIRNCTASPRRLTAKEYYTGKVLGVEAPVDGLNVNHVQYGWPGAVTQSVEQALYADKYAGAGLIPPGSNQPYEGSDLTDLESPKNPQTRYRIGALSFETVIDNDVAFDALIVKPCPHLETPLLTQVLNRVADATLNIHAHYRFYSYTDGAAAENVDRQGPPTKVVSPMPEWDATTGKWLDWSDPSQVKWVDVPYTVPAVCSTFVWQAVRNIKGAFHVRLDWADNHADALGEAGGRCVRRLPPDWLANTLDPYTIDGLYFYDEETRRNAADWLYNALKDKVYKELKSNLRDEGGLNKTVADAIDIVGRGAFIAAATLGPAPLVALLGPYALALDIAFAEQLIELLYDMPQDIASQACNSFAFDCHRGWPSDTFCVDGNGNPIPNVDSTYFADAPGVGRTVSPDNIAMFWDAPGATHDQKIHGLYGFNAPVQVVSYVVRKPVCRLVRSTGTATIRGRVLYNAQELIGAHVEAACQHSVTQPEGEQGSFYNLVVRSDANYKLVARYEFPDRTVYGEAVTGVLAPGAHAWVDIKVTDPPACLRKVTVSGTIRVDDVYVDGADHAETKYSKVLQVQWGVAVFDPVSGTWTIDPNDPAAAGKHSDHAGTGASQGAANAGLLIEAKANPDLSVDVTLKGSLGSLSKTRTVSIPAGVTDVTIPEFRLDTDSTWPERAYFRDIKISNLTNNAI
jgi:hypothetical protein